jgi:hypothetical protein
MSPLNAAGESLQKLIEVRDLAKFGDTFRKLHGEVLAAMQGAIAAQTREAALLERVGQLEKEVASFETWDAEKEHYELKALRPSVFAYMLKRDARGAKPPHWVCANCYGNRKISIFQWTSHMAQAYRVYQCAACKSEIAPSGDPQWMN